jgi:dTDP-glucose 4,6-dehydratase
MEALIYLYRPNKIIHFAAWSHVDDSIETPEKHARTNVLGTISLLIAASKYYNCLLNE